MHVGLEREGKEKQVKVNIAEQELASGDGFCSGFASSLSRVTAMLCGAAPCALLELNGDSGYSHSYAPTKKTQTLNLKAQH